MPYRIKPTSRLLFPAALLCAIALAPQQVQADERTEDDNTVTCKVNYYLTAPYNEKTRYYDHVVVFEDNCRHKVSCELVSGDVEKSVTLDGKRTHRVTLSSNNERPGYDATADCSAAP